jgi:ribosomal protein S18 acetylase RimI-like enzyme
MTPDNIRIRAATPQDAQLAGRLAYEVSVGEAHLMFGRPESIAKDMAIKTVTAVFPLCRHTKSYDHTIIAEQNGTPCGLLMFYNRRDWQKARCGSYRLFWYWLRYVRPSYVLCFVRFMLDMGRGFTPLADTDLYVEALAVLPERRNCGIGQRLVQEAADLAREQGLQDLVLDCDISNKRAQRFYDRLGFQCVRTVADASFTRYGLSGQSRLLKKLDTILIQS